jgi:hypothetical protein
MLGLDLIFDPGGLGRSQETAAGTNLYMLSQTKTSCKIYNFTFKIDSTILMAGAAIGT